MHALKIPVAHWLKIATLKAEQILLFLNADHLKDHVQISSESKGIFTKPTWQNKLWHHNNFMGCRFYNRTNIIMAKSLENERA